MNLTETIKRLLDMTMEEYYEYDYSGQIWGEDLIIKLLSDMGDKEKTELFIAIIQAEAMKAERNSK